MKRLFLPASLVLFCLMLGACAPQTVTRGASMADPAWRGGPFRALVVEAETGLQERDIIENTAALWLNKAGVATQTSLVLTPPTRDISRAERKRVMMNSGMQGLLVITPLGKEVIKDYIPPSRSPFRGHYGRYGRHDRFGIGSDFGFYDDFYDPGIVLHEPQSRYEISIFTLPAFERIWTAELSTRGASGMDFNAVAERFAVALVGRLVQDGMIAAPGPAL